MLTKAVLLLFLLIPLFLASGDGPTSEDQIGPNESDNSNTSSSESESQTSATSSDENSEASTSTTSGSSYIMWTNVLILTVAIIIK